MKLFVNSLPKSGTNLVAKLVMLVNVQYSGKSIAASSILGNHQLAKSCLRLSHFSGNNIPVGIEFPVSVGSSWLNRYLKIADNQYLSGHAAFSEQLAHLLKMNEIKQIQILRHPAAVLVSWAKFIVEDSNAWHPSHAILKKMNLDDCCHFLLEGGQLEGTNYYQSSIIEILHRIQGWLKSDALIVRFEDVVGSQGGGDDEVQRLTIADILRHIGKTFDENELDRLQDQLYGGTHTFRSGQIDSWQAGIKQSTLQLMQDKLSSSKFCQALGYSFPHAVQ